MKYVIQPVTAFAQNCTIFWCEETMKGAAVDAGGDIDQILAIVAKHGVTLEKLLVTHGHLDHVGAVGALAKKLGLPIEGPHRADAPLLAQLPAHCEMFGFPPALSFTPDRWLEDGDQVTVGNLILDVLFTPGHAAGEVCFFHAPSRFAIVGDVLFAGSIGRTDFPGGDYDTLIRSIRGKLWPLGNDVAFVPGHGPMSTFGEERRSNYFVRDGV